jgi:3-dehydroquinate synthase
MKGSSNLVAGEDISRQIALWYIKAFLSVRSLNWPERREMTTISVELGNRGYSIHVENGLVNRTGNLIGALQVSRDVIVLSSKAILSLHGEKLLRSLRKAQFKISTVVIPDGERSKSLMTLEKIYRQLSRLRASRRTLIVAFGGGVVGDVAGFAAASYLRGLPYVQVPTTLLAQIDSAIGGKTGVNLPSGKNLIGAFYQPRCVITDPLLLGTLPPREFRSGIYEAIKYGIIRNARLFHLVNRKQSRFPRYDRESLEEVIVECSRIKADVVSQDETESGLRMILNYGHTLGHALESATNYRRLTHGEAIGHGMIMANQLAQQLERLTASETEQINDAIQRVSALPSLNSLRWDHIFHHMLADKKFVDQSLRFVLPRCIGEVEVVKDVPRSAVQQILRSYLRA